MTPDDMTIQQLRRRVRELEYLHQLDQSEIVKLRRQVEALEEQITVRNLTEH